MVDSSSFVEKESELTFCRQIYFDIEKKVSPGNSVLLLTRSRYLSHVFWSWSHIKSSYLNSYNIISTLNPTPVQYPVEITSSSCHKTILNFPSGENTACKLALTFTRYTPSAPHAVTIQLRAVT